MKAIPFIQHKSHENTPGQQNRGVETEETNKTVKMTLEYDLTVHSIITSPQVGRESAQGRCLWPALFKIPSLSALLFALR